MHFAENIDITNLTTMRIPSTAERVYFPDSPEELISLLYELKDKKIKWSILGGGSNSLVSSVGVSGALIVTTGMDWINRTAPDTVVVGGGLRLPKLAGLVAQMELSGCEFYEGIPGSVGGAVIMNAGAHGHNTAEILERVVLLDTKRMEIVSPVASQLDFGYRQSGIDPDRFIVIEAKLRLRGSRTAQQISDTMKEYHQQRSHKQPKGFSCGCVFRNPSQSIPAGKLIEEMGLKGIQIGGAEVSSIHANFIVNSKAANSESICSIIQMIQTQAWQNKKLWLKPEVQRLGDFSDTERLIWLHPDKDPDHFLHLRKIG